QAVLKRDLLRAHVLLHRQREIGAALHGGVVRHHHHGAAADHADACDDPGARRIAVVEPMRRERRQLEERRAGVEQALDPVAHEELAARGVALDQVGAAALLHRRELLLELRRQRALVSCVGLELVARSFEMRLDQLHCCAAPKAWCETGRRGIAEARASSNAGRRTGGTAWRVRSAPAGVGSAAQDWPSAAIRTPSAETSLARGRRLPGTIFVCPPSVRRTRRRDLAARESRGRPFTRRNAVYASITHRRARRWLFTLTLIATIAAVVVAPGIAAPKSPASHAAAPAQPGAPASKAATSPAAPTAASAQPKQPEWVQRSNANSQILIEVFAKLAPEQAGRMGVPGLDAEILDLKPGHEQRGEEAGKAPLAALQQRLQA